MAKSMYMVIEWKLIQDINISLHSENVIIEKMDEWAVLIQLKKKRNKRWNTLYMFEHAILSNCYCQEELKL